MLGAALKWMFVFVAVATFGSGQTSAGIGALCAVGLLWCLTPPARPVRRRSPARRRRRRATA